jgi:hypothetical protein
MKTIFFIIVLLFCIILQSSGQQIVNVNASQLNIGGVDQIELKWQTINEYTWCYFVIERETNNNNIFTAYDTLIALGNTTSITNYLFTDFGPLQNGSSYCYRLALWNDIDFDAVCEFAFYSDTVCVNFTLSIEEQTYPSFYLYPNPTNGKITISNSNIITSIEIYNAIGEIIYKSAIYPNISGQFLMDISGNSNGMYFIVINSDNNFYYQKLIKQ